MTAKENGAIPDTDIRARTAVAPALPPLSSCAERVEEGERRIFAAAQAHLVAAQTHHALVGRCLAARYGLGEQDRIDTETGAILRAGQGEAE